MPKPKGTCGATKMKIMAVIRTHENVGKTSYGYNIWQCLKGNFYMYINDNDIRNVYHHLNDLYGLGYLVKCPEGSVNGKQCYRVTDAGKELESRYSPFMEILKNCALAAE